MTRAILVVGAAMATCGCASARWPAPGIPGDAALPLDTDDVDAQALEDVELEAEEHPSAPARGAESKALGGIPSAPIWQLDWTSRWTAGGEARHRAQVSARAGTIRLSMGFEHDPGEAWRLAAAAGRFGFDHAAAFAEWAPSEGIRLVAGAFRAASGLGLLFASPRFGAVGRDPFGAAATGRRSGFVRPYSGADEDRYLSGLAVEFDLGSVRAASLLSVRNRDAAIEDGGVARLRTGGDHASVLGASRRAAVGITTLAQIVSVRAGAAEITAAIRRDGSSLPLAPPTRGPGDTFLHRTAGSLAIRAASGPVGVSAEWARAGTEDGLAAFVTYSAGSSDVLVGLRKYGRSFAPLGASPPSFRTGAPGNESGSTLAWRFRPARGLALQLARDAGCRRDAEPDYPLGACRTAVRLSVEHSRLSNSERLVLAVDSDEESGRPVARVGRRRASAGVAFVRALTTGLRIAATWVIATGGPGRGGASSAASAEMRWDSGPWSVRAGAADHHVVSGTMAVYESPLPLASGLRTVSGDGASTHLLVTAATGFGVAGLAVRRSYRRSALLEPLPAQGGDEARTEVGLFVRFAGRPP